MTRNRFFADIRNVQWVNDHASTCPAHGLVRVTGWESSAGYVRLNGTQPAEGDGDDSWYVINGPAAVISDGIGRCSHEDIGIVLCDDTTAFGDSLTTTDGWTTESGGAGNPALFALGVKDADDRVLASWTSSSGCAGMAQTFGVPDSLPVDVVGWVPYWTIVDGELVCQAEEVADCPAAAPIQTTFDTEDELVAEHDPTTFPTGTLFYVTDDLDPNRISDVYMVQGTANNLGDAFVRVGGLSPEEERQLAFWAVNQ